MIYIIHTSTTVLVFTPVPDISGFKVKMQAEIRQCMLQDHALPKCSGLLGR